jgi:DNA-formamidopyrimidine glycosylase
MPELPEVETVVRELNRKLKGRTIKSVEVLSPKIIGVGPKTISNKRIVTSRKSLEFQNLLAGQKVVGVKRRAKLLIFELQTDMVKMSSRPPSRDPGFKAWIPDSSRGLVASGMTDFMAIGDLFMLVHLKMTGQFIFEDESLRKKTASKYRILNKASAPLVQLPYKHTHVVFNFVDGSTLYYNDVRRFGYLKLVAGHELNKVKEFSEYGPEPLTSAFKFTDFLLKTQKSTKSIKQVLMDNIIVVGIGNIYSDEILFHSGVRPDRKSSAISKQDIQKIFDNIKPVLKLGIQAKGSSVGDFIRTDGSWGSMGKHHFVYGRKGKECLVCGSIIKSAKLGGRTSSFCINCQQ